MNTNPVQLAQVPLFSADRRPMSPAKLTNYRATFRRVTYLIRRRVKRTGGKMITHELMRELLNYDLRDIQEIAECVPNEIVYKALVIREFMLQRKIEDPREGIRQYTAYERERLKSLGFLPEPVRAQQAAQ